MHRLIEDLRFFIGAFFLIIGVLLLIQGGLIDSGTGDYNLNLWTGTVFVIFAVGALFLSARANKLL